jgi:hypothetical protein
MLQTKLRLYSPGLNYNLQNLQRILPIFEKKNLIFGQTIIFNLFFNSIALFDNVHEKFEFACKHLKNF